MIRMPFVVLAVTCLFITACGQEQPSPAQPKPEAKPTVAPAAPAPAAPAVRPAAPTVPAPPSPPAEAFKPAAPAAEMPKTSEPATAPAKPAAPAAPVAPTTSAKPAVKLPAVPDTLTLTASQGQVTLPHLAHAKLFPCATCHGDGTPGKIELTKDTAHALCRDCHKAKGAGPTACGECHKK